MIFIDRMLASGIRFVFDKVLVAAEAELDDGPRLRERLLDLQMRLELGEVGEEEFAAEEAEILAKLRELRERERAGRPAEEVTISGVEVSVEGDL